MFDTLTRIGASASGAYEIDRSLRFNRSDSANLTRTSSATSSTWTYSGWVKRSLFAQYQYLFSSGTEGFAFHATGETFYIYSSVNSTLVQSTASFRDPSAWYHVVVQMDSGTANAWINNVQTHTNAGGFALSTGSNETRIGSHASNNHHFDGYMAEIHFVDGQTLTPSSFAETDEDTGQWVPKKYAGSYGTDGFYLDFSDNSGTTATTLGKDKAGSNNFTPNNFSVAAGAGCDSVEDTPTNNFCTINPIYNTNATYSNGNLDVSTGNADAWGASTFKIPETGKWFFECTLTSSNNPYGGQIGADYYDGNARIGYYNNGQKVVNGTWSSYGDTLTTNDVVGTAINRDDGEVTFYKNGTSQGTITSCFTAGKEYYVIATDGSSSAGDTYSFNFGQRAFAHSAPTGYKTLCTANLSTPTIQKSTDHFDVKLWSGNAGTQNITGLSFQPDFVWNKCRSASHDHQMWDAVRGATKSLRQDTEVEATHTDGLTAFNSDGITWGLNSRNNGSGQTYAGFFWDESASAGFDIVSYTGNASGPRTISHSLGVKPELIIVKNREQITNWMTYHKTIGAEKFLYLNTTASQMDDAAAWNDTEPTSSVFTVNADQQNNGDGDDIVAYLWASVEGFSKIGSYVGNGSADGPFVYTGFKPAWLMVKGGGHWLIQHNKVEGYNPTKTAFLANANNIEEALTNWGTDFLANGFKVRGSGANRNQSGVTFVYIAMAESPFKYSNAR